MPFLDLVDERPSFFVEATHWISRGQLAVEVIWDAVDGPDVLPDRRNVIEVAHMIVNR